MQATVSRDCWWFLRLFVAIACLWPFESSQSISIAIQQLIKRFTLSQDCQVNQRAFCLGIWHKIQSFSNY
jgi:hypothetical protein